MLKFNKVLLASDFDNTLVYTQGALDRGEDIPPMSARRSKRVLLAGDLDNLLF